MMTSALSHCERCTLLGCQVGFLCHISLKGIFSCDVLYLLILKRYEGAQICDIFYLPNVLSCIFTYKISQFSVTQSARPGPDFYLPFPAHSVSNCVLTTEVKRGLGQLRSSL